jgi:hypothetical protein
MFQQYTIDGRAICKKKKEKKLKCIHNILAKTNIWQTLKKVIHYIHTHTHTQKFNVWIFLVNNANNRNVEGKHDDSATK